MMDQEQRKHSFKHVFGYFGAILRTVVVPAIAFVEVSALWTRCCDFEAGEAEASGRFYT